MIRYELKKLLRGRTGALLAALVLLNLCLALRLPAPGEGRDFDATDIQTLYAATEGLEPQAAAARLAYLDEQLSDALWNGGYAGQLITGDLYAELSLVGTVLRRVQETADYPAYLENVLATQAHLLTLPVYREEGFDRRNLTVSGERYRRLRDVKPRLCYTGMAEALPGSRVSDVILLLAALLIALTLFSEERRHRPLLLPLKRGGGPLYLSKLAAGGSLLALGVLLLYGSNLLVGLLRCGMTPLSAPIQSIYGFQQSPWHVTVGAYYGLFLLSKLLAVFLVFGVPALACTALRTPVGSAGLAAALLFAAAQPQAAKTPVLRACGVLRLWDTERLFQSYANLNLFGTPVPDGLFTLLLWTLVGALCLVCAAALWRFRGPSLPERNRRFPARRSAPKPLFFYEARKLLVAQRALLTLLAFLLLQLWSFFGFPEKLGPEAYHYLDYVSRLHGAPNAEKDALLARRQADYDELRSQLAALDTAAAAGELTPDAYAFRAASLRQQLYGEELLHRVRAQYDRAKRDGGEFVSLLGWERLLGKRGVRELPGLAVKLALCLSLGLAACHTVEAETGMEQLLNASVRKRRVLRYKRLLSALYAAAACAVCVLPPVLAIRGVYGLDGLSSPAVSVPQLGVRFGSVGLALALCGCAALLLTAAAAALTALLSRRLRRTVPALIASAALLSLPGIVGFLLV